MYYGFASAHELRAKFVEYSKRTASNGKYRIGMYVLVRTMYIHMRYDDGTYNNLRVQDSGLLVAPWAACFLPRANECELESRNWRQIRNRAGRNRRVRYT